MILLKVYAIIQTSKAEESYRDSEPKLKEKRFIPEQIDSFSGYRTGKGNNRYTPLWEIQAFGLDDRASEERRYSGCPDTKDEF